MGGIGTSALLWVVAIFEIIVALLVAAQYWVVAPRREFHWGAVFPTADHPGRQQLRIHPEPRRLLPDKATELGHFLLKPPEHHVRTVAHPRRRHLRGGPLFRRMVWMLPRIAEHELPRPQQILAGQHLIGSAPRVAHRGETAYPRLRYPVEKAEVLPLALRSRPSIPYFRTNDFYRGPEKAQQLI